MIQWEAFDAEKKYPQGNYLVTDGVHVEIATLDDGGGEEAEWILPERTRIDGVEALTHFAEINLPKTKIIHSSEE